MRVTIHMRDYGEPWQRQWSGDLTTFFADNDMESDLEAEIRSALRRRGTYSGGGGASTEWKLTVARPRRKTKPRGARTALRDALRRDR